MAGRFVEATVIHITLSYSAARTVAVGDGVEIGDTVGISQSRHHFAANAAGEIVVAMPGVSRYDDVTKDAGSAWGRWGQAVLGSDRQELDQDGQRKRAGRDCAGGGNVRVDHGQHPARADHPDLIGGRDASRHD